MELARQIYDLVIVGAGPAGLEAALQAKRAGMNALLIDREEAGYVIESTMNDKRFYHAYGQNVEGPKGLLDFPDRSIGSELVALWRKQANSLLYRPRVTLKNIEQDIEQASYKIFADKGMLRTERIIMASGMFSRPKRLGVMGEEGNVRIAYEFDYRSFVTDKKILVVGGGNSAIETALELAPDNEVTLLVRKPQIAPSATERNRAKFTKAAEKGLLRVLFEATVVRFGNREVVLQSGGKLEETSFDTIYIHIGYEKQSDWVFSLGLELDTMGLPKFSENLESSKKGIYVTGALTGSESIVGSANQSISIIKHIMDV